MILTLAIAALLLSSLLSNAATHTAASVSYTDVNAKVSIAADGDTVNVPAGTATWGSTLTIPAEILLQGAGTNDTIITRSGRLFNLYAGARITGFTFNTSSTDGCLIQTPHSGTHFRIYDCVLRHTGATKATWQVTGNTTTGGQPYGLFDHCTLYNGRFQVYGHANLYDWAGWAEASNIGTSNNVFIEDCVIVNDHFGNCMDANYGARYVFRKNTVIGSASVEAHGMQNNTSRGTKSCEVYGNLFTNVGLTSLSYWTVFMRGGQPIVVSNMFLGTYGFGPYIAFDNYRNVNLKGFGEDALRDENTALYTGTHTGANGAATLTDGGASFGNLLTARSVPTSGNPAYWLVNVTQGTRGRITAANATTATASGVTWNNGDTYEITGGYRPRDGIGAGPDTYLGTTADWPAQTDAPAIIACNTNNGVLMAAKVVNGCQDWIKGCRDYTNSVAGWTPFTYPHPLQGATPAPDPVTLTLSTDAYTVGELDGTLTITGTRGGSSVGAVSAVVSTEDVTAQAGRDYTAASATLSWGDGVTGNQTTAITILHNGIVLGDMTFNVTLSDPSGASVESPSVATVTITEGDTLAPPAAVGFDDASLSFSETVVTKLVTVYRYDNFTGSCSVNYATSDATAIAGTDYTATSGTLTFADSETTGTVSIPITLRAGYQGNRTFRLLLSSPTDCSLTAAVSMELEIEDSQSPPRSIWRNAVIRNSKP